MEKAFRPIPLERLARWVFRQLDSGGPVLGIPRENFQVPGPRLSMRLHGHPLAAPLGVAAGPHTQLAQNIVASWLCGARFIELKTVQVKDDIQVSRPCIDAADATYNCEWSQELTLAESYDEYLKAWVLVHALSHRLGLGGPGTVFNMSVGYTLEGIQSPSVQRFLSGMRDGSTHLPAALEAVAGAYPAVREVAVPSALCDHVTLSTMHGCPPAEIERIARYLLLDLGVNTWVKLNPTLLGPKRLRGILNQTLGHDIEVPDLAFEHDPRFDDAVKMVRSLALAAKGGPRSFGVKLSNTLEVVNRRPVFPATEKMMYLSGRALHPLTLTLAAQLDETLCGEVPLSFCGGADAVNFPELVKDGLSPVTTCTDLLKPGGYARLQQYLVNLEEALTAAGADSLECFADRSGLAAHAERAVGEGRYSARERPLETKGSRALSHFDCIAAPCQEACPSHQNIPDYLWHLGRGEINAAMEVILRTNALPGVTGCVCDRPCTEHCVRNHFEAPLAIRELKRFAVESARVSLVPPPVSRPERVGIIGAGPAGLSAAYFLARGGFKVTLFEARTELGGMASSVIPAYRLTPGTLANDLERIRALGAELKLGVRVGRDLPLAELRRSYDYLLLAVGAAAGKRLGLAGEGAPGVFDALEFLEKVRAAKPVALGRRVLVVGGGNSAMDAARSARRLVEHGTVDLVYRRTRAQMPADPEEVRACVAEGIGLRDLLAPLRLEIENGRAVALVCQKMKLGEPDASGRARPVPVPGEEETLPFDTLIPAIGQDPVLDLLRGLELERAPGGGIAVDPRTCETSVKGVFAGGDLVRGPSSVIQAIADGRAAAEEIARRHGLWLVSEPPLDKAVGSRELLARKARQVAPQTVPVLPLRLRSTFDEGVGPYTADRRCGG
ncbi:MAG: FAD-dependent oxidoreductase, partial [Myxococcaceae bacterium]